MKKKDRDRKRKERRRKARPLGGVARETKANKGAAICGMMEASKQNHPTTREDAVRNYITQHVPGTHITFEQRQTLARS